MVIEYSSPHKDLASI